MILYLGNKLSQHGFTPTSVETLGPRLAALGYETVLLSSKRRALPRLADMLNGIYHYRKRKPMVLIDTYSTSAFWYAYFTARACRLWNLRYVPILRGGELPSRLDRSPHACRLLFGGAYRNIAVSEYLHAQFGKRNYQTTIIPNFIDISAYPFLHRASIAPSLLWVRAFHSIYHPEMAIRVFHNVRKLHPQATLCMVGPDKDGSLARCRSLAASLNIPVTFTGKLDKSQWTRLSADYGLFINTTHIDNTPVSVMEAMALGMPVVTTNAGGIPYLFRNGEEGIIVPVNDEAAMSEAVLSLLADPAKAAALSAAARARALTWDWQVVAPKWKSLLDEA